MKRNSANNILSTSSKKKKCELCCLEFTNSEYFAHQRSAAHKEKCKKSEIPNVECIEQAFENQIETFLIKNLEKILVPETFFNNYKNTVFQLLEQTRTKHGACKVLFGLHCEYIKLSQSNETEVILKNNFAHLTKSSILTHGCDLEEKYKELFNEIITKMSEFQERDSGWSLKKIDYLEINVSKFSPLTGSSYIATPKKLARKLTVINIKNNDNACFKWAILSYKMRNVFKAHSERFSKYKSLKHTLNFTGIEFPVKISDINKFEKLNHISVNVYGWEKEKIVIYHLTKNQQKEHVNLLLLLSSANPQGHYCWIKNISRFISSEKTKHNGKIYQCYGCLITFNTKEKLNKHQEKGECAKTVVEMPAEDTFIKFDDVDKQLKAPFAIYADFESLIVPIDTCLPDPDKSSTTNISTHVPSSFAYQIVASFDDNLKFPIRLYRGEHSGEKFLEMISTDAQDLYEKYMKIPIPMKKQTFKQFVEWIKSEKCHICTKSFENKPEKGITDKVKDHDHYTGEYRGPAHPECNLLLRRKKFIPVFLHCGSRYDFHLFVKYFKNKTKYIKVIPDNMEQYISMTNTIYIGEKQSIQIRFLDSFRFMPSSIEKLTANLEPEDFKNLKREYPSKWNLLTRKGVYPYQYINSLNRFNELTLPSIDSFSTEMNGKITTEDYDYAQQIFKEFNCNNLGDYSDLYLKTDVLLLADIFEKFRNICLKHYGLDPAHYFTAPGLSWSAMLKLTEIELELLSDYNMYAFYKRGIRGGIVQSIIKHVKANNQYLNTYDSTKPSDIITYIDANNLYGLALSQNHGYRNFKWIEPDKISSTTSDGNIILATEMFNDNGKGYTLEVDLEYPKELHDLHNDLPFCPEFKKPPEAKFPKLLCTLEDKKDYVIHYKVLEECIKQGLILKKIHKVIQYDEKDFLKMYIDLNTELRSKAVSEFEKDFFKLMNNSIFGKTMEDIDKRRDVRLLTHWERISQKQGASTLIARPNYHSHKIFSENLVAIQMNRISVLYNKPIYIGFSVLELSKLHMYQFHYNTMQKKYKDNIQIAYMDTDSFIYKIQSNDFYADIKNDLSFSNHFDTSAYPADNRYGIMSKNKKVLGKFKDEVNGDIITEFVGLRSKMYTFTTETDKTVMKAKGVAKNTVKTFNIELYKAALDNKQILAPMYTFRSVNHTITTQLLNKIALSSNDDKRYLLKDGKTLAWGHKDIN